MLSGLGEILGDGLVSFCSHFTLFVGRNKSGLEVEVGAGAATVNTW